MSAIIERLRDRVFLIRNKEGQDYTPDPKPLIDSMLRVFLCPVGYLIEAHTEYRYGGFFLMGHSGQASNIQSIDIALRQRDIVVYNKPGIATLVCTPVTVGPIQTILDEQ